MKDPVDVTRKEYLGLLDKIKKSGEPVVLHPQFEQEGYDTAFNKPEDRFWVTKKVEKKP